MHLVAVKHIAPPRCSKFTSILLSAHGITYEQERYGSTKRFLSTPLLSSPFHSLEGHIEKVSPAVARGI